MEFSAISHEDEAIEQENLIRIACIYTNALTVKSGKNLTYDESSPDVMGFLATFENIFSHGLKKKFRRKCDLWTWVSEVCMNIPHNCIKLIESLDNLKYPLSKLRALLRLGLQSKRFHLYIDAAFNSIKKIRHYYNSNAVLFNIEIRRLNISIVQLQTIDFCFDLRSESLNFPNLRQIDYAAFICTAARSSSILFSDYEEKRFTVLRPTTSGSAQSSSHKDIGESSLCDENCHLHRCRADIIGLNHENRTLRAAFDQLQVKVALLHEEYTTELKRLGCSSHLQGAPTLRSIQESLRPDVESPNLSPASIENLFRIDQGLEVTEEMDELEFLLLSSNNNSKESQSFSNELVPICCQFIASGQPTTTSSELSFGVSHFIEFSSNPKSSPTSLIPSQMSQSLSRVEISEQDLSALHRTYQLPDYEYSILSSEHSPIDVERMSVLVKPKNTNFRFRFALPRTPVPSRTFTNLLSEIQGVAETSFALTDRSPNSEATSDQISEISADSSQDSQGRSTIVTSTSTIRPPVEDFDENDTDLLTNPVSAYEMTASANICSRKATSELYRLTSPSECELDSTSDESCLSNGSGTATGIEVATSTHKKFYFCRDQALADTTVSEAENS